MRFLVFLFCLMLPLAAFAQEEAEDRGYLAGVLEDALGGEGRDVRIEGFEGAFSSAASIARITISDRDGVWLTLTDVVVDWNRSALLRGRIEVNELSAASIDLPRAPLPPETNVPDPEATPFALPDLPVSIRIGTLDIDEISLGAPILGEAATLSLEGNAQLADGSGSAQLNATRIDDKTGELTLDAAFTAGDRALKIDLLLSEGADGIAARLMGLPNTPSLDLRVVGDGTLSDFTADIGLATDGADRLTGTLTLVDGTPEAEGAPAPLGFDAALNGDVTALFLPQYRDFFGDDIRLVVRGERAPDGALALDDLSLQTRALSLQGQAALNADAWPTLLVLDGEIANQDGTPVLLPISGGETRIDSANLRLRFDAAQGDAFRGGIQLRALNRADVQVETISLGARGTLQGDVNAIGQVIAALRFSANEIDFADPDVARAVGRDVTGAVDLSYLEGRPLELSDLSTEGATWSLTGEAAINALASGFETIFDADITAQDLSAFAPLVGQPLSGSATLAAEGSAALGGFFDVTLTGQARDLSVGIAQADTLLRGTTQLDIAAKRDEAGLQISRLEIENPQLGATASATLATDTGQVQFDTRLANANLLAPGINGPLTVTGTARQAEGRWTFETQGTGPYGTTATVNGTASDDAGIDLRYTARIPDFSPLVVELPGPLRIDGTARQQGELWAIETALDGPSGTSSTVSGTIAPSGRLNLSVNGTAPLGLANPALRPNNLQGTAQFDLAVNGAPALNAVSGTITTSNARFVAPALRIGFGDIDAQIGLSGGVANLQANADVLEGGNVSVTGPITLSGAFPADLSIALNGMKVVDPTLYETTLNGALSINGGLRGGARIAGQIDVGETIVQVPASGISTFGALPEITHQNAPRPVMRTLDRAGLLPEDTGETAGGPAFPLDILVRAPSRIFVRGRGLDAELGGSLRLTGTSADIISTGRFELIRGRLDVLSKRFELDEGAIQLQGRFEPFLRFVAITETATGTASVILDGPAAEPTVRFEATPDAPQDEVLAQVFFGRDASQLSAFQALQLANAVATLAGNGGAGIISNLRQSFDLDDLDVTTDEDGNAAVRAGKYLSDNIYTDVTVGGAGGAAISLNIDLTPNITAKGSVEADSNTSLGIFFERDY
ncbi:translocation/assembly module TamB domain-containing protein [Cognatishimia sp. MH4019]|uniref:translocation/assembly module TamB domain-containing protein n=1 Tax=Cognatishimia sp. MH4019 TaxID=2854030 RepID=UPI001CD74436|nr:translocation/assembly module TamB domain-containing protein [Cognatishimia sp. MH4019]